MSHYLFDNPWPLAGVALLAAAALAAWFMAEQRLPRAWAVLAALALAALVFILDASVVTPRERLDGLLDELADAVRRRDPERLESALANDYRDAAGDRAAMIGRIRAVLKVLEPRSLSLNGRKFTVDGATATASFVAVIAGSYQGHQVEHYPARFRLAFRREGDDWKLTRIDRLDLVGGKETIPLTQH